MVRSIRKKGIALGVSVATFILLSVATSPAIAGSSSGSTGLDWLCSDPGPFVGILGNLVSVFMVGGPVAGIILALFYTVADSANPEGEGEYASKRRKSLLGGFGVPVGAYAFSTVSKALFSFDISCIIPSA